MSTVFCRECISDLARQIFDEFYDDIFHCLLKKWGCQSRR